MSPLKPVQQHEKAAGAPSLSLSVREPLGAAVAGQTLHCKNTHAEEAQASVAGPPLGILRPPADVAEFGVSCECRSLRAETNKVSLCVGFVRIRAETGELKGLRDF